jgi:hypothetical protein
MQPSESNAGRVTAAVFADLATADRVVEELVRGGVPRTDISVADRAITDEPVAGVVEPLARPDEEPPGWRPGMPVETPLGRRDRTVATSVARTAAILAVTLAVIGAALGGLVGWLLFGRGYIAVTAASVGVMGAVLGGVWGYILASMRQARQEGGVLVEVRTSDPETAERVRNVLSERQPLRFTDL